MIHSVLALLTCQLAGEAAARVLMIPLPGPVIGMLLMLAFVVASGRFAEFLRPTAQAILANLSLLFVPAGVGVVGHISTLGGQAVALLIAVVVSTLLAIAAGALTFVAVARIAGATDE